MIEPKTLIRWTHELVDFANGGRPDDGAPAALFTEGDYDAAHHAAHALTTVLPTPEHMAALREATRDRLAKLTAWRPAKTECPKVLLRTARDWLEDPFVTSTHAAFSFTPMDGVLSLTKSRELVVVPRFHSIDAQYAVTFAELLRADAPARVKRCALDTCGKFFVHITRSRGRPPEACSPAHASSARVHKFRANKLQL